SPQDLSHTPGLCDASARPLRCVTVVDLRDVSKSTIRKMAFQRFEPFSPLTSCNLTSLINLYVCGDEGSHQPRPHCALMVGAITLEGSAGVSTTILRVAGRQAAQAIRCEQMLLNLLYHLLRAFRGQHGVRQADRQDLVGTD